MIKTVIIDDEFHSRESLREMLRIYCPEVTVVAEAEGVNTGLKAIETHNPDLVFLDIRMPDGSGFDLLQRAKNINFRIVFVTAYEEYAIKAFRFNAIDYILKPLDAGELKVAVDKAKVVLNNGEVNESIRLLLETMNRPHSQQNRKIVLKTLNTVHVIEIDKIMRCESDRNYTGFYLVDGENILISRSMKEFEDMLEGHGFFRVHNSHLINLNYVRKFLKDELICVLSDNTSIPVSHRKRDELMNAIKNL